MSEDPRLDAARYRVNRLMNELGEETPAGDDRDTTATPTADERAMYVEVVIQQAMRRGDFDDLPGYGKPLEGLGDHHDPDWWIRRKIRSEQLTGLGPPALTLRVEHAEFSTRLDALTNEQDVREHVHDFNRRVIEARRQLLGGPPVVTPLHDVEADVAAWRERRAQRERAASSPPPESEPKPKPKRRWRRRKPS